jgi:cytochrome c5
MPRLASVLTGIAPLLAAATALGATGEETYKSKCGLCHDSGAAAAPRINDPAVWALRLANGREPVYQTALKGKPDTAMMPKGGFPDLSDADVRAAVDYMLLQAGYRDILPASPRATAREGKPAPAAAATAGPAQLVVGDKTITADVAEALRSARDVSPPSARVEVADGVTTVRGVGIKIEVRDGVVTLRGVVEHADVISKAERIARTVGGVKAVDNKLIASSIFEHD